MSRMRLATKLIILGLILHCSAKENFRNARVQTVEHKTNLTKLLSKDKQLSSGKELNHTRSG